MNRTPPAYLIPTKPIIRRKTIGRWMLICAVLAVAAILVFGVFRMSGMIPDIDLKAAFRGWL